MADIYKKPTSQELEAQLKATQDQLDKEIAEDTTVTPAPSSAPDETETTEETVEVTPPEEKPEVTEPPAEGEEGETEEETKDTKTPEEKPQHDYEKRYRDSSREADKLYHNNVAMNKAIEEANGLPVPTVDELKAEFPEWEDMSDTERMLATDALVNKRFRAVIGKVTEQQRNVDQWHERVEKFIDDPKTLADNPDLDGKEKQFTEFVLADNKLVGTDFTILVSAFLHDYEKNKPAPKKGKMFEVGSSGPNDNAKPKDDKIDVDLAATMMTQNYNEWKRNLLAGKLKNQ